MRHRHLHDTFTGVGVVARTDANARRLATALLAVLLIGTALAFSGCVWVQGEAEQGTEPAEQSSQEDPGAILPSGRGGENPEVLMMGRSVMYGWFDHDDWDGRNELRREGYWFFYGELETPPTIADSADAYIAEVPDATILFFKLCFDDFYASDDSEIEGNLAENLGYVEQVVATANERDMILILGNALPKVRVHTTPALVETHIAYNDALETHRCGERECLRVRPVGTPRRSPGWFACSRTVGDI